jgi:hypothetical protein
LKRVEKLFVIPNLLKCDNSLYYCIIIYLTMVHRYIAIMLSSIRKNREISRNFLMIFTARRFNDSHLTAKSY